jgi:hypothetical protein
MNETNGVWTQEFNDIVDIAANFTQNWLEDNINEDLYLEMQKTASNHNKKEVFEEQVINNFKDYFETRQNLFNDQLDKLKISEEN